MMLDNSIRNLVKFHYDDGKNSTQNYQILTQTVSKSTIYRWLSLIDQKNSFEPKTSLGGQDQSGQRNLLLRYEEMLH